MNYMKMKDLRAIIEDESLDNTAKMKKILDLNHEETDSLREQLDTAQSDLKKAQDEADSYKSDKEKVEGEFTAYKQEIANKDSRTAKENAARSYFESKGIKGKSLDIAVRGAAREIDAIEMNGDKIKDCKSLDDLVSGVFSGLVSSTETYGTSTENPTGVNTGGGKYTTKNDIMKIRDSSERQKAIAENPQLFGL